MRRDTNRGDSASSRGRRRRETSRFRPRIDVCEDRTLLSTFTVTNLNDAGAGSLRQAILNADGNSGADTIKFQGGLSGTIALSASGGPLVITDPVDVQGPGADKLSVSGGDRTQVFVADAAGRVSISGLTITHGVGSAPDLGLPFAAGGGLLNVGGNVTLIDDTIVGDQVSNAAGGALGGGLANVGTAAMMTLKGCRIDGDAASGGFGEGAGAANLLGATMTITNCDISENQTVGYIVGLGGGVANDAGSTITVKDTGFNGNVVSAILGAGPLSPFQGFAAGGGLANLGGSTADIQDCAYSGNRLYGGTGTDGDSGQAGGAGGPAYGGAVANAGESILVPLARSTMSVSDSALVGNQVYGGAGGKGGDGADGGSGGDGQGAAVLSSDVNLITLIDDVIMNNRSVAGSGGQGGTGGNGGRGGGVHGGAIDVGNSSTTVRGCSVTDNIGQGGAGGSGGAGGNGGQGGEGSGGAYHHSRSPFTLPSPVTDRISDSEFAGNEALGGAGGAAGAGGSGGQGGLGEAGGVAEFFQDVTVEMTDCDISGNVATGGTGGDGNQSGEGGDGGMAFAGGYRNAGATTYMTDVRIASNVATGGQGGAGGQSGNGGQGGAAEGGAVSSTVDEESSGVLNDVSLTVMDSAFIRNSAVGGMGGSGGTGADGGSGGKSLGGAIYTSNVEQFNGMIGNATLEVLGTCRFTGNQADGGAGGDAGSGGAAGSDGSGYGGAIFIGGGSACISEKTDLRHNHASTADDNISGSYTSC